MGLGAGLFSLITARTRIGLLKSLSTVHGPWSGDDDLNLMTIFDVGDRISMLVTSLEYW